MKGKTLQKLLGQGYKPIEIKYSEFRVYEKDNMRVLYSKETDRIIVKYHKRKND